MAISTYSDLKASVAAWLHRTDLTGIIPDFITMAEARLNRALNVSAMEQEDTLTATIGSPLIALPSSHNNAQGLWVTTYNPRDELIYVMPQDLLQSTVNGYPNCWTIDGAFIRLDKPADIAYSLSYRYTQTFALSDSVTTNWLLTKHPDLYLFAALQESAPYLANDARLPMWQSKYAQSLAEVLNDDHANKSLATLTTDHWSAQRSRFDINRGY